MKKWQYREGGPAPADLAEQLNISNTFLNLLWKRGFRDSTNINNYLNASLQQLTNPDKWPQIPEAARVLVEEILKKKKIAVWGDYDADGVTATAVVLDVLEAHGVHVVYHIPDRRSEGYGLNVKAIEELAAQGCEVLLTVDCGISNNAAIDRAKELGMTVVVSDHHIPPEKLPDASACVNPHIKEAGNWPYTELAGVGVAFYLMAKVNSLLAPHTGCRYAMDEVLDLVALGTIGDVMALAGENRILVRGGLKYLGKANRRGIYALKMVSGVSSSSVLTSSQISYQLTPRINAAGRMGHANLALQLLRAKNFDEARKLAEELDQCNKSRKEEEAKIHREARQQALELLDKKDYSGLALYGADWHPGIVGIVASRIVDEFGKPAFVLHRDRERLRPRSSKKPLFCLPGLMTRYLKNRTRTRNIVYMPSPLFFKYFKYKVTLRGSGRSIEGIDLNASLVKISDTLIGFGGHKLAAGVRIEEKKLETFREAFSNSINSLVKDAPEAPPLLLDDGLTFEQAADFKFLRELELMQPFGIGNVEPVFASPRLLVSRVQFFKKPNYDLTLLDLKDLTCDITLRAKVWRSSDVFSADLEGQIIQIAYTPKIDKYNGIENIYLDIKDWHIIKEG